MQIYLKTRTCIYIYDANPLMNDCQCEHYKLTSHKDCRSNY